MYGDFEAWHPLLGQAVWSFDFEKYAPNMKYSECGDTWMIVNPEDISRLLQGLPPKTESRSFVVKKFEHRKDRDYKYFIPAWARAEKMNRPWDADFSHSYCSEEQLKDRVNNFMAWFARRYPHNVLVLQAGENEAKFVKEFLDTDVLEHCLGAKADLYTKSKLKHVELQAVYKYLTPNGKEVPGLQRIIRNVYGYDEQKIGTLNLRVGVVDSQWQLGAFVKWAFNPSFCSYHRRREAKVPLWC